VAYRRTRCDPIWSAYIAPYPRGESIPPRRTIGQVWLIIRRLRRNSPSIDGTIFSSARAAGSYTALHPRLTMLNGNDRSWPMRGSTTR
jgi:hypothetical protein